MHLVGRIFTFQHHVVNAGSAMLAPVAAAGAGIEQRGAKAVIRRAANHQVVRLFGIVLRGGWAQLALNTARNAKILRNGAGDEVNDAAHVLRSVAHGARAANHVYGIHIAQRYRRQRQLGLAVGGEGHRDAVHQHRRAAGQARVEAADAKVHRQVVTPGPGILRGVDSRNAVQHLAHSGGAGFGKLRAANNVAGAGVLKHVVFPGVAEPVADYRQRRLAVNGGGLQRPGVIAQRFEPQAAAVEQRLQAILNVVAAVQAVAVLAPGQAGIGCEGDAAAGGVLIECGI